MGDMPGYRRVNYYELCRLCTSSEGAKMHIFREEGRRRSLPNKIQKCLPLTVREDDSLPKIICSVCAEKLEIFYDFRESCINAEAMLESYFTSLKCSDDLSREVSVYIKDDVVKKKEEGKCHVIQAATPNATAPVTLANVTLNNTTTPTGNHTTETLTNMTSAIQILSDQDGSSLGSYKVEVQGGVPSIVSTYPSAMQQVKASHDGGTQTPESDSLATTFVAAVITPQSAPELFSFDNKDKYQAPLAQVSEFLKMKNISIVDSATPDSGDTAPQSVRINSDQLSQLMVTTGIQNKTNASTGKSLSGSRPFGCTFCGKAFSRKEHLIRHKVSHTGKREYKCEVCNKTFSRKDNLLKHKKTHGIIGPYVCAVCGKSFVIKHYYLVHRESHDKEELEEKEAELPAPPPVQSQTETLKCHLCGKAFLAKASLATHLRIRHPRKRPSRKRKKPEPVDVLSVPRNEHIHQPMLSEGHHHHHHHQQQQTILASFPITAGLTTINPHALLTPGLVSTGNMVQIGNTSYVCTELLDQYQTLQS